MFRNKHRNEYISGSVSRVNKNTFTLKEKKGGGGEFLLDGNAGFNHWQVVENTNSATDDTQDDRFRLKNNMLIFLK